VAVITGSGYRETWQIAGLVGVDKIPVSAGDGPAALKRILAR
jgi:hypothetical protein